MEKWVKPVGVLDYSKFSAMSPYIDQWLDEGKQVVIDFGSVTGITSFACRQIAKLANEKGVRIYGGSVGVTSALLYWGWEPSKQIGEL